MAKFQLLDGVPIVCGGSEDNVGESPNTCSTTHDECFSYVASSNTWELRGRMPSPTRWMAHTYSDAAGWTLGRTSIELLKIFL